LDIAIGSLVSQQTWTIYPGQWIDYWGYTSGSYGIGITTHSGYGSYTVTDSITSLPSSPHPAPTPPPAPAAPPPVVPAVLVLTNTSTHHTSNPGMDAYSGPVVGLTSQYIYAGADALSMSTTSAGVFLHSGSGDDALQVFSGDNVLDGSTGSNFLTGGTGNDTFFVDDRGPSSDIWSTIVGFHAGDNATIWGVTAADFPNILDNQGAAGAQGMTGGFVTNGHTINATLAGYSKADIDGGRLTITFGHTADTATVPGSDFMNIHGN
jgi:Ca2+-binding RTX toxin-like protein